MIKVDIISGFLGAGKTTLIKMLAKAASEKGERVVIIENEFGEIGIDGKVMELAGLKVFEITQGCLCCSVKNDFIATLMMVAGEIHPDRILIEPSGIFVPADVLDIFNRPGMEKVMRINALINVLDSLHYLRQRVKYSFFFENQIRYAKHIVMSKTGTLSDETLLIIRKEIKKINAALPVSTKAWDRMTTEELFSLISPDDSGSSGNKGPIAPSPAIMKAAPLQSGHKNFASFTLSTEKPFTKDSLRHLLEELSSTDCGKILRAKGFVKSESGSSLLEFNYVDKSIDIVELAEWFEPSVYFIGENLNEEMITRLF